jgi:hypothetical protein
MIKEPQGLVRELLEQDLRENDVLVDDEKI